MKKAVYEDLYTVPENMIGEIISGELIVTPRPSRKQALSTTLLGTRLTTSYTHGEKGGLGGWIIIVAPEIGLGGDILVPDLAGWKVERFPATEETNWISTAPDWVCEVLSPSTFREDKVRKMPVYGRHGVGYFWSLDPTNRILEAFRLETGKWVLLGAYGEDDKARIEPFDAIEINLSHLWLESVMKKPQ